MRSRIAPVSPSATSRPLTSTTTRGAMRSTSGRTCDETSTVRPSSPSRRISSTTWRRCTGSRPLSGSSSSSSSGSCTSAWASLTRWRMPFEKPPTRRSAASSRPTVASALGRRGLGVGDVAQPGHQLDQLARGQERPEAVAVVDDADAAVDLGLAPRVVAEHAHRARARDRRSPRRARAPSTCPRRCGRAGPSRPARARTRPRPGRRCRRTTWRRLRRRASGVGPPVAPPQAADRDRHHDAAGRPPPPARERELGVRARRG